MLELQGVTKSFGSVAAVRNIHLRVRPHETTVLLGPSGCGKSTLLRLLMGLVRPDHGRVLLGEEEILAVNARAMRQRMGYVIQDGGLFPHLTARQNVCLLARHLRWDPPRIESRIHELCGLVRLPRDCLGRYPVQLSGGQRQRVSLMRALMLDPQVLLLDEPLGALDPLIRADLQADLRQVFRTLSKTVVLVTHDIGEAGDFGDDIVLLRDGTIMQRGSLVSLVRHPASPCRVSIRPRATQPPRVDSKEALPMTPSPSWPRQGSAACLALFLALAPLVACHDAPADGVTTGHGTIRVGSKKFTESVILGEIAARLVRSAGAPVLHRSELGGTRILWNALLRGDLDIYPEYSGTLIHEILAGEELSTDAALRLALAQRDVFMGQPIGFNNTYAIGMMEPRAEALGIHMISDLVKHPRLRFGFTAEFMDRTDGWPSLRDAYGLPQRDVRGLDHDLAYRGLERGSVDVSDLYSTDAEIQALGLRVLEDDRGHFPEYAAVFLWRRNLEETHPNVVAALHRIEHRVSAESMIALNARAKLEGVPEARVAGMFLWKELGLPLLEREESWLQRVAQRTREHIFLVAVSLGAAILLAVPLGVSGALYPTFGHAVLAIVGIVQTIPSLALLVFMIPLLGIGAPPAMQALFLYSLLPIVRNTLTGLRGIPSPLRESAEALGLPPWVRLTRIDLPLASGQILAGIKTSAILNIGTATLGALIGAGGYGQPILTGIRLNDVGLILQGALPAAILALAAQGAFDIADRWFVPRGLRLRREI